MHVDGSGHVDVGFGGATEVCIVSQGDELQLQIKSEEEHYASMSAALDSEEARALGERLIAHSVLLDEDE